MIFDRWPLLRRWIAHPTIAHPLWHTAVGVLLWCTLLVVALVAWQSRLDSFPDENLHVVTASYYVEHWLPPAMDEQLAPYTGVHGVSYFMLWPPQASYFVVAKVAAVLRVVDEHRWIVYRGVCVALWALLLAVAVPRVRRYPALFLLVGLTPQVWYIFTYFSADAMSYCAAACVVALIAIPDSSARRFLETGKPLRGALALGASVGVLALSKMNYMTFALVALVYCLLVAYRSRHIAGVGRRVTGCLLVAATIAGPFLTIDLARNGIAREAKFERLREQLAAESFKPSAIESGTAYRGLGLKQRGLSAIAMFSRPWRWGLLTSRSFFGTYGTMNILSPRGCHGIQRLAALGMLALAVLRRRRLVGSQRALLGLGVLMVVVSIAAAFWRAWTFDFQAQGRYVFAIIPIVVLLMLELAELRDEVMQWVLSLILVSAGAVSILSALPKLAG